MGERLARFLRAIAPSASELADADQRVGRIKDRLRSDFQVSRVLTTGSHSKGTAVRQYSDHDLFVVFSRDEARKWAPTGSSETLIGRVRRSILSSYPSTSLRIDKQAVRVAFEQGAHAIDVVPAVFDSFDPQYRAPVYLIPDGIGAWLRTAPDLHKRLVDDAHERSGRKLKGLIRMLKWWAASRTSTSAVSSLYMERFAIWTAIPVGYTYQQSLRAVFSKIAQSKAPDLSDPYQVSQTPAHAVRTSLQRAQLLSAAAQSEIRSVEAIAAEQRGNDEAAIDRWSLVFNRVLPSRLA